MDIQKRLSTLSDAAYAEFNSRLIPNIPKEAVLGVRVPLLRTLAKEYQNTEEAAAFMRALPHRYHDENMLHALLISQIKDYDACLAAVNAFLPYVDNWAVCDSTIPRVFARHKAALAEQIQVWIASPHTYTCRFGLGMLMRHFLDEDFKADYLSLAAGVSSEEYYVNMMVAWLFATALAKQWDAAVVYFKNRQLNTWVHNKAIQKACESRRITSAQKAYLKTLKQKENRK